MEPQVQQDEMTPEDAKASMGIATTLQDMMMQAPQEEEQDNLAQTADDPTQINSEGDPDQGPNIAETVTTILDEIKGLKEEMEKQKDGTKEFNELKAKIEKVLDESQG